MAEAILCFAILTLVIILIFNLYPTSVASVRVSGQRLQATALADSILDEQMERPFGQLVPAAPVTLPPVAARGAELQPSLEIYPVTEPGVDPKLLVGIRVRVVWTDHGVRREILREAIRCDLAED
jgi:hypothetical protein